MLLLGGIKKLLHDDGTTIKGVQKILREQGIKHVQSLSQPVGVKVSVKKKTQSTAENVPTLDIKPSTQEPVASAPQNPTPSIMADVEDTSVPIPSVPEPISPTAIDPMSERMAMPAYPEPIPDENTEPEALEALETSEQDEDQDDLDLPQAASLGEPDITVTKFPEILKAASKIPHKDMQEIEALYYSLKMVRNNMKRTGAGR
jgi:hypothetical protein